MSDRGDPVPAPREAAPEGVRLRASGPEDRDFLQRLYASSRPEILAIADWDATAKESLLTMQFETQQAAYAAARPNARVEIVERHGRPVGRLVVDRREDEIHLVDIALLPDARGHGLGGILIAGLCREAARAGLPLRLYVEHRNPAQRLYRRLGFVEAGGDQVSALMEWVPGPAPGLR